MTCAESIADVYVLHHQSKFTLNYKPSLWWTVEKEFPNMTLLTRLFPV